MTEKNKVGRPLKYTDPADMQEDIDRYFEECKNNRAGIDNEEGKDDN